MNTGRLILAIHQTANRFYPGINNIPPDRFYQMVETLGDMGITMVGISEGDPEANDDRRVSFTFDDGYLDNIDAIEYLLDRGVCPAVFIPTGFIGQKNSWEYSTAFFPARHLNREQIRGLAEKGVEFGSHGVRHRALTELDDESIIRELVDSKNCLEEIIGGNIYSVSFPYGSISLRVIELAGEAGFRRGYAMHVSPSLSERFAGFIRPRIPIYGLDDYYSLRNKIEKCSRLEHMKDRIINMMAAGSIIAARRLK